MTPPLVVVGEAGDATEALALIDAQLPDLVVCDLNMPEGGGLRVVRETTARHGDSVKVVMFTVSEHERDLLDTVASGAYGYLPSRPRAPSCTASCCGPPRATRRSPPNWPRCCSVSSAGWPAGPPGANPLSEREREVLNLVARGYTYRQVGKELFIAEKTVENHVRNILGKLHLTRRAELIRWAADHDIR